MREIKFRAWDDEWKRMRSDVYLDNDTWDLMNEFFNNVDLEWLQYTGLKDKNDIEIYEGDIILVNVFMSKHVTGLVAFDRGSFCVTGNFEGWGYDCNTTNFWEMSTNGNEYKVIGNIYENPELAK